MSSHEFQQWLEVVPALSPDQLRILQGRIEAATLTIPEQPDLSAEEEAEFQGRLLALGIVNEIKPPRPPVSEPFTPIVITGEPMSVTVIRERR